MVITGWLKAPFADHDQQLHQTTSKIVFRWIRSSAEGTVVEAENLFKLYCKFVEKPRGPNSNLFNGFSPYLKRLTNRIPKLKFTSQPMRSNFLPLLPGVVNHVKFSVKVRLGLVTLFLWIRGKFGVLKSFLIHSPGLLTGEQESKVGIHITTYVK
ncbi:Uncharacterized protein OBRU01_10943 [Operophtera brumata]|uniref:Uncharacterized protein n=1 Tax=Operophtera brumata TaxID=104452 RepID=A0A0L7LDV2_OPEBR|nr:Uncharacterized protein OBRU01_10943 [Operophtera brumata]